MASRDEFPTVRICIVCKGNPLIKIDSDDGTYVYRQCRWCTDGVMSTEQYQARLDYEKKFGVDTKKYDTDF